jgi:DNA-binding transcriptional regulator YdaS (Cro superfamily)
MLKKDAIKWAGSQSELARKLGIDRAAVHGWGKYVPMRRAMQLHELTGGELKFNQEFYLWNARGK